MSGPSVRSSSCPSLRQGLRLAEAPQKACCTGPAEDALPLGAIGDLDAARRVARGLLAGRTTHLLSGSAEAFATMVLSAAGLHAAYVATANVVVASDLLAVIRRLQVGEGNPILCGSPVPFVRYVGDELKALQRGDADEVLVELALTLAPSNLATASTADVAATAAIRAQAFDPANTEIPCDL